MLALECLQALLTARLERSRWKENPVDFWQRNASDLVKQFKAQMESYNFESNKIGQSLTAYQAVRSAANNAYKDELLQKVGIEI